MIEIWKPVNNTNQQYYISNYGKVMSMKRKNGIYLTPHTTKTSRSLRVRLSINRRQISMDLAYLVAEHYLTKPKFGEQLINIDGNPNNCRADNLMWINAHSNQNRPKVPYRYLSEAIRFNDLDELVWLYEEKEETVVKWLKYYGLLKRDKINTNELYREDKVSKIIKVGKTTYLVGYSGEIKTKKGYKSPYVIDSYLVALAFVENKHNYHYVKHLDGDTRNNRASNLAWIETKFEAVTI